MASYITNIERFVIHCAATPNGKPFTIDDIDRWHKERGFHRSHYWTARYNGDLTAVGYHFVIHIDGDIRPGRHICEVGAHARGWNHSTLGICLIGADAFTKRQWEALKFLVSFLSNIYPDASPIGHRDLPNVRKLCPGFDVATWLAGGMAPLEDHILAGA